MNLKEIAQNKHHIVSEVSDWGVIGSFISSPIWLEVKGFLDVVLVLLGICFAVMKMRHQHAKTQKIKSD